MSALADRAKPNVVRYLQYLEMTRRGVPVHPPLIDSARRRVEDVRSLAFDAGELQSLDAELADLTYVPMGLRRFWNDTPWGIRTGGET